MRDYQSALDYLFAQLPMYHRVGAVAYKKDLTNTLAFCERLGNPQARLRCIHVGGTNGKGSVSHILAAILQAQGYRVGLYVSPHYRDFRERIKIDGEYIPKHVVIDFVAAHRDFVATFEPSFFEWTVAMAFDYFAKSGVDIAIIEVGLGGRLDSTNVISPILSIITNISFDHVQMLGDTLPLIAAEKAGIIKSGVPVVVGETNAATKPVFLAKAAEMNSDITFADQELVAEREGVLPQHQVWRIFRGRTCLWSGLVLDASGDYQRHNLLTVLQAVQVIWQHNLLTISEGAIRIGLSNLRKLTNFVGRWQVISDAPLVICDSAHNEGGLRPTFAQLMAIPHQKLHIVVGFVNDKDVSSILGLFPTSATYYFVKADIPRGLSATALCDLAATSGLIGKPYTSVRKGLAAAKRAAKVGDIVFVGGSIFVVAEVI